MSEHAQHTTVLKREAIESLALTANATAIDATLGSGGHSALILETLGEEGRLLAIDADPAAVAAFDASSVVATAKAQVEARVGNFRHIRDIAQASDIEYADAILADLGWRMEQFAGSVEEGGGKGFSFARAEPLSMTYGDPSTYPFTAIDIVNEWRVEDLQNVLKGYGEERYAPAIARAIVAARESARIETSTQLAEIVAAAVPGRYRNGRINPATKTFQALRIAVNDELDALREFIAESFALLRPGGRLSIITFHSIEDRIAKQEMRALENQGLARRITKKPIIPTEAETTTNPRARSAKLRTLEKI